MRKNKISFAISVGAADDANDIALWYDSKIDGPGYLFLLKLKESFDKVHSMPASFARLKRKAI
jgi:hypothetical protein